MGFLHKLWDETLAGPAPESGLGKLRKYDSFSAARSSSSMVHGRRHAHDDSVMITRSITVLRSNSSSSTSPNFSLDSPVTPLTPLTPGTPAADFKKFTRRKDHPSLQEPTSPIVYDWLVMNALDR